MYRKRKNGAGKSAASSNIVHLFRQNRSKLIPKPPRMQHISKEQEEDIKTKALHMCIKLNDADTTASSRWILGVVSRAYRAEILNG